MTEFTISFGNLALAVLFILIIVFHGGNAIDCYLKRQLVKANFWLSSSIFSFIALVFLFFLVDSCSE
jgi:chromate transport protein ChrA